MRTRERKTRGYASRGASFGVIGACIAVMALVVAKGMQLDKEDAEKRLLEEREQEKEKEE